MDFHSTLNQYSDAARCRLRHHRANADAHARAANGNAVATSNTRAADTAADPDPRCANRDIIAHIFGADGNTVAANKNTNAGSADCCRDRNSTKAIEPNRNDSLPYKAGCNYG